MTDARELEQRVLDTWDFADPVNSLIHPAFASSAVHVTSSASTSMLVSSAASRRTICSRWPSASRGSFL